MLLYQRSRVKEKVMRSGKSESGTSESFGLNLLVVENVEAAENDIYQTNGTGRDSWIGVDRNGKVMP